MPRQRSRSERQAAHASFMAARQSHTSSIVFVTNGDIADVEEPGRDLSQGLEQAHQAGALERVATQADMPFARLQLFLAGRITNPRPGEVERLQTALRSLEL